jgi:hypothetical protein
MDLKRTQWLICLHWTECVAGGHLPRGASPERHVVRAMRSVQHVPHEAARVDVPSARHDHDVRTAACCHHHIVRLHPRGDLPALPTVSGRYATLHAVLFALFIYEYLFIYCFVSLFLVSLYLLFFSLFLSSIYYFLYFSLFFFFLI